MAQIARGFQARRPLFLLPPWSNTRLYLSDITSPTPTVGV